MRILIKVIGKYLLVSIVLAIVIVPMSWVFISSLKSSPELMSSRLTILPKNLTFSHYPALFEQSSFGLYFLNSTYVALFSTLITVILSSLAAYSVYRCRYGARRIFARTFLSIYIFPKVLLLIPLYSVFVGIKVIDTLLSLVIINVTINAPFSVWILRTFFTSVPTELEDAALVDGATRLQVLFRIFFPIAAPGIGAVAINSFLMSWTEYLFASTFIISDQNKTLPYGMAYFLQRYDIDWGILTSGSVLIALPPLIGFALAGRYYIKGLAAGAIK